MVNKAILFQFNINRTLIRSRNENTFCRFDYAIMIRQFAKYRGPQSNEWMNHGGISAPRARCKSELLWHQHSARRPYGLRCAKEGGIPMRSLQLRRSPLNLIRARYTAVNAICKSLEKSNEHGDRRSLLSMHRRLYRRGNSEDIFIGWNDNQFGPDSVGTSLWGCDLLSALRREPVLRRIRF